MAFAKNYDLDDNDAALALLSPPASLEKPPGSRLSFVCIEILYRINQHPIRFILNSFNFVVLLFVPTALTEIL